MSEVFEDVRTKRLAESLNEVQKKKLEDFLTDLLEKLNNEFKVGVRYSIEDTKTPGLTKGDTVSIDSAWDRRLNVPYAVFTCANLRTSISIYPEETMETLRKQSDSAFPVVDELHADQRAAENVNNFTALLNGIKLVFAKDYYTAMIAGFEAETANMIALMEANGFNKDGTEKN